MDNLKMKAITQPKTKNKTPTNLLVRMTKKKTIQSLVLKAIKNVSRLESPMKMEATITTMR